MAHIDAHLIQLCREYCDLVDNMRSGSFTAAEIHELDSERQGLHNELIRLTGRDRSTDMYRYAKTVLHAARVGGYQ